MPISPNMVETSDDWITTRTGIKQRRKAAPDEYTSLFAVRAARQAIERARFDPSDIDLLLVRNSYSGSDSSFYRLHHSG